MYSSDIVYISVNQTIKAAWDQKGDWGDVVFTARVNTQMLVKPKALEVKGVRRL